MDSAMDQTRRFGGFATWMRRAVLVAGLLAVSATAPQAGPGHNHGEEQALPAVSLDDLRPRAMASGTWFEVVAMPVSGALAIFLDDADTNAPVLDAYLELLTVADEPLVAEQVVPGVYLASPWPPAGVDADALRGSDVVMTIVAEAGEDLLVLGLSDALVDASLESGETPAGVMSGSAGGDQATLTEGVSELAAAEKGNGTWLILMGGLISLAGLSAGLRYSGVARWVGMSAVVAGLVMGISTAALV